MKRFPISTMALFLLSALPLRLSGQAPPEAEIEVVPLSEGAIIVRSTGPQPTNVIALDSRAGIVVIDTGISPALAHAMRLRIREAFSRDDFAFVINTHEHGDHTYGNQAFADVPIVGQDRMPSRMKDLEGQRERTLLQVDAVLPRLRERLSGMEEGSEEASALGENIRFYELLASSLGHGFLLTPPRETFRDRRTIDLGDKTLNLVYFGEAHSPTDILVFCPEEGILASGDLFYPDNDLYIDSGRVPFLNLWRENLDWALREDTGVRTVVPGHGDPVPMGELERLRAFVADQEVRLEGKKSAFLDFRRVFEEEGLEAGLSRMDQLLENPEEFFFFHAEFDSFVYGLMLEEALDQAVPLFEKLALLFPDVPNAHDSLGEAYMRAGRPAEAGSAFERCLKLDPEHQNAGRRLAEIRESGTV